MENKKPNNLSRKVFLWNAAGSFTNALSSVVLLAIVTRILGPVDGGIFTIAFALAQQLLTVSNFETPVYHVTDTENKIGFGVHFATKIVLFLLSTIACVFIAFSKYSLYKALVVILVCLFKGADAFSGLFSGLLQRNGRLDIAGKSLAFRVLISMVLFTVVLLITKNLIYASVICIVLASLWFVFYDGRFSKKFESLKPQWNLKLMAKLIVGCLPMFLGTFLLTYIINQPKFVIDNVLDEVTQNKFGIIFIPSAVICLLAIFIYRPLLTTLTDVWKKKEFGGFLKKFAKIAGIILTFTALCTVAARFLGIPVLSFVYGQNLAGLEMNLCYIILGGGMYALSMLIYNGIVIMRHQYIMLIVYVASYGVSLLITEPLVKAYGLMGASLSYLVSTFILALLMSIVFVACVVLEKRKVKEG